MNTINTKRTELANQFAAAGAEVLEFGCTACAIAAIPDTEPQQYVAAGTPEDIAKLLPATIDPARRQRRGERPDYELEFEDDASPVSAPIASTPELQQLKAIALAATSGPWSVRGDRIVPAVHVDRKIGGSTNQKDDRADYAHEICIVRGKYQPDAANAAYIAAASPAVVLDLIARIEALQAGVKHD